MDGIGSVLGAVLALLLSTYTMVQEYVFSSIYTWYHSSSVCVLFIKEKKRMDEPTKRPTKSLKVSVKQLPWNLNSSL